MDTTHNAADTLHAALHAAALGYRSIPCRPGTKVPAVKWKRYQSVAPTLSEYREWFDGTPMNIAILTGEVVVVDCDTPDIAGLVIDHCGETPTICLTPRGGCHLWYRRPSGIVVGNHVRVQGHPVDVRAEGGLALIPPSRTDAGMYAWMSALLPVSDLPIAATHWTVEPRRPLCPVEYVSDSDLMMRRARAYIAHIEGAMSGFRGHDRTMRVAGVLVQKFGLTIEQAMPLFLEWNEQCEPPWSEKELLHKLQDASRLRYRYPTGGQ